LAYIAPLETCFSYPAIPVTGRLANTPISTTVDSALAKDYLAEDGTIEENAEIIARIVRAESKNHSKLILVSTSKGGPETALALGKILRHWLLLISLLMN
jgi:hypothetical protein